MKRKVLAGLLVGLMAFGVVGFAHADSPAAMTEARVKNSPGATIKGEITAIDGDALTVQTEQRGATTVQITGRTRFRAKGDPNFTLADLKVGDVIAAQGRFTGDKTLEARRVILVPADLADTARGKVTAIDGGTITIEDKDGSAIEVVTSEDTKFRVKGVEDATLADVKVDMLLGAAGRFDASGSLIAGQVLAGPMPERKGQGGPIQGGEVSEVNGGEIVIDYIDGSSLTVTTDATTLVIQRGNDGPATGSLSDVTAGSRIVVMGTPSSDGSRIAARVILVGLDKSGQP